MKKIIVATAFLGIFAGSLSSAFAGYFSTPTTAYCDKQITSTLSVGLENNEVYALQQLLLQEGHLNVNPNGYFGPSTLLAVKRFQSANGISATGIVGAETRNVLNERMCEGGAIYGVTSYDSSYGTITGTTYVDQYDPYARVISPTPSANVYNNPQSNTGYSNPTSYQSMSSYPATTVTISDYTVRNDIIPVVPATSQIQSTGIVYSSNLGYLYGVVPTPGSITITSPLANSIYNEGDTVNLSWTTNNLNATTFQVLIENTSTGQTKQVAYVSGNHTSFILTRELLNGVCSGTCDNNQQGNFRFVIATPVTDIAGVTSNFRAMISPITIRRPYSVLASLSISASKTPVSSLEGFRMYVNTPGINTNVLNSGVFTGSVIKLRALCVNPNVSVSIASVPCGQDFTMPLSSITSEQGIPVIITNSTWFTQDVVFEANIVNISGQVMGTAQTKVTVNPASFNW